MKKILFAMIFTILSCVTSFAYQHEPNALGMMYLGESLTNVKKEYKTAFLNYGGNDGENHLIFIPDLHSELGFDGPLVVEGSFDKGQLWAVTILFPNKPTKGKALSAQELNEVYGQILQQLTDCCGTPKYVKEAYLWTGNTTLMILSSKGQDVRLLMIDPRKLHEFAVRPR